VSLAGVVDDVVIPHEDDSRLSLHMSNDSRRINCLPLLFYYDTRLPSYPLFTSIHARKLRKRCKIRHKRKETTELPQDVSVCVYREKITFNYNFEDFLEISLFHFLLLTITLEDTNGCWIIGAINCVRFVTSYKMFTFPLLMLL
jgi:hypothetical protein